MMIVNPYRFGAGSGVATYWLATLGAGGADSTLVSNPAVDASGNIYLAGRTSSIGAGGTDLVVAKYSSAGVLLWQRTLGGAGNESEGEVALDSAGNVYVVGSTTSQGAGQSDLLLVKYNSSGVLQWQRSLGGAADDFGASIAIGAGDAIYVAGRTDPGAGNGDLLLARYDSAGAIQWQRRLGGAGGADQGYGVAVSSAGNVYLCGYTGSQGAGNADAVVAQYDSSGTLQWQRILGGTGSDVAYGVSADLAGGVYVVGYTASQGAGGFDALVSRYNSSGTLQWQRTLGGAGGEFGFRAATDTAGSLYVAGRTDAAGAGGSELLLAKYDSAGTLQWQRLLGGASNEFGTGVAIGAGGEMCVLGRTESAGAGGQDIFLARLPSDGSLTGTYGAFTYSAGAFTDAASTLTAATSTLTAATTTLTDAARTLTDAAGTLTGALTPVA